MSQFAPLIDVQSWCRSPYVAGAHARVRAHEGQHARTQSQCLSDWLKVSSLGNWQLTIDLLRLFTCNMVSPSLSIRGRVRADIPSWMPRIR